MGDNRVITLRRVVIVIFAILILRLFYIQVIDGSYKRNSADNALRFEVQHPPRGEVYDRNGEFLVQSKEAYDLMVVPSDMSAFDTTLLCSITQTEPEEMRKRISGAIRFSRRRPSVIVKQMSKEMKLRFDELNFPGFYTLFRTIRSYPRNIGGNLLGEVGEVNDKIIKRDPYYRGGDYIGTSGIELAYEEVLRGRKGVKVNVVDVHGVYRGNYQGGVYDTLAVHGVSITSSIDARLQTLGEELMRGKVGSIVAIEPSTGEILVMVSSPTYDPDELVGRNRSNHYMELLNNKRRPLFNRAVMASYPPGSTFKLVQGLIGLQEGVLRPETTYPCHGGYTVGRGVACHNHSSPLDLIGATQNSCNAYFCYVFRNILDRNVKEKMDVWKDYVLSFGFGRSLGSDFKGERNGYVPDAAFYDKRYDGRWNSLTTISLAIGQGELGCTPLQMANLAATVANRGYYYTPHIVKRIHDRDSIDARFYQRHFTKVDGHYFDPIVEGMFRAVNRPGGTAGVAAIEGIDVCGKTGTAQNPHGADHSTFLCFAPRNNPRIAISVYVENGRFGATVAAPIASLLVEQYLTDTIKRPELVDRVKNMNIYYPAYAK